MAAVSIKGWTRGSSSRWQGCSLDSASDHKHTKGINKTRKAPKTGANRAEDCEASWGLEQEVCKWGPRAQCFPGLGEGGSDHGHPPRVGGWVDDSVRLCEGEHRGRRRDKVHTMQQGKFQKFHLRVEEHWNKGPKSLWHFHLWRYSKISWARLWATWSDLRVSPALSRSLD